MTVVSVGREGLVEPDEQDRQAVRRIDAVLRAVPASRPTRLVSPTGESLELPEAAFKVLSQAIHLLAEGHAVAIVPYSKMLTTQETADLLNVSRPHLIKLLEAGQIPFEYVGTHRRIRFDDLMRFRAQRDQERKARLDRITQTSQELGLYDKE
jgi:excisionase family DNA binding protein